MRDKYVASSIELVLRDGKSKSALREMFLRTDERTRFLFVRALSLNVNLENVLDVEEYVKTHCVKDVLQSLARISASTTPSLKISQDISWTLLWQSRVSNNSFTSYLFRGGQVRKGYKLLGDRLVTSCSIQPVCKSLKIFTIKRNLQAPGTRGGIAVSASEDPSMLCEPKGAELVWSSHRWVANILHRLIPRNQLLRSWV